MSKDFKGITTSFTKKLMAQFVDKTDNFIVEEIIKDREQYPEKYADLEIMIIDRDEIKNKIKLGINAQKTQEENQVLRKALELACEDVKNYEQMQDREYGFFDYDIDYDVDAMVKDYIQQAKESLNEN